ncbi:16865_t:CDS:2, partial [Gigaspora margarita]
GLSASDNASGIPPAFVTPPNNVSALTFGQSAFGQSSFGAANLQAFALVNQHLVNRHLVNRHLDNICFGQARPFGTPAVLSTVLKPQSGSGFARFASNNILGAGGNNFGGANASVNTTKSSFTEFCISNNSLASSIGYDKTISSQKKNITPPSDSTPSRNLGSNQPTEADSKTPHMIRMNATNNEINEYVGKELENSYIAKYHDRTTEQPSSMPQALADLRRQVNEFNYVKTTKDIEHLMYTPSTITVSRRGILQSRIKERLETTFK